MSSNAFKASQKGIAVAICLCLIWTSGSLAEAAMGISALSPSPIANLAPQYELVPPPALGRITDYFNSAESPVLSPETPAAPNTQHTGLVILIQDLHANYSVQKNIAGLLDFLAQKLSSDGRGLRAENTSALAPRTSDLSSIPFALAVEGASGPIDTSEMALYPDPTIKQEALDYLMRQGMLTGMEYFAAMNHQPHLLVGVEEERYYTAHRDLFRQTLPPRTQLIQTLTDIQIQITALRPHAYSQSLRKFQATLDGVAQGTLSTDDYVRYLLSKATKMKLDLKPFSALREYATPWGRTSGTGEGILSPQALHTLTQEFLQNAYGYLSAEERKDLAQLAKQSSDSYYLYLRDLIYTHQLFAVTSPELAHYLEYLHTAHTVNMEHLLHDADELAYQIKRTIAMSDEQHAMRVNRFSSLMTHRSSLDFIQVEHDLALLLRVANLQATEPEVRAFGPRFNQFMALASSLTHHPDVSEHGSNPPIRSLISSSIDYYAMALLRNKPMVENTLALLGSNGVSGYRGDGVTAKRHPGSLSNTPTRRHSDTVVLVAGGFHTTGLTQLLRERNISYLVIMPTVESNTEADHALYIKRLNGQYLTDAEIEDAARHHGYPSETATQIAAHSDVLAAGAFLAARIEFHHYISSIKKGLRTVGLTAGTPTAAQTGSIADPFAREKYGTNTKAYRRYTTRIAPAWETALLALLQSTVIHFFNSGTSSFWWATLAAAAGFAILHTIVEWIYRASRPKISWRAVFSPRQFSNLLLRSAVGFILILPFALLPFLAYMPASLLSYGLHVGWNEATQEFPEAAPNRIMGPLYYFMLDSNESISALEEALRDRARDDKPFYQALEETDAKGLDALKALEQQWLNPEHPIHHQWITAIYNAYKQRSAYPEMVRFYERYTNRFPEWNDDTFFTDYILALNRTGHAQQALEHSGPYVARFLAQHPDWIEHPSQRAILAELYIGMGTAYKNGRNYKQAFDYYRQAYEINFDYYAAGNMQRMLLLLNHPEAARAFGPFVRRAAMRANYTTSFWEMATLLQAAIVGNDGEEISRWLPQVLANATSPAEVRSLLDFLKLWQPRALDHPTLGSVIELLNAALPVSTGETMDSPQQIISRIKNLEFNPFLRPTLQGLEKAQKMQETVGNRGNLLSLADNLTEAVEWSTFSADGYRRQKQVNNNAPFGGIVPNTVLNLIEQEASMQILRTLGLQHETDFATVNQRIDAYIEDLFGFNEDGKRVMEDLQSIPHHYFDWFARGFLQFVGQDISRVSATNLMFFAALGKGDCRPSNYMKAKLLGAWSDVRELQELDPLYDTFKQTYFPKGSLSHTDSAGLSHSGTIEPPETVEYLVMSADIIAPILMNKDTDEKDIPYSIAKNEQGRFLYDPTGTLHTLEQHTMTVEVTRDAKGHIMRFRIIDTFYHQVYDLKTQEISNFGDLESIKENGFQIKGALQAVDANGQPITLDIYLKPNSFSYEHAIMPRRVSAERAYLGGELINLNDLILLFAGESARQRVRERIVPWIIRLGWQEEVLLGILRKARDHNRPAITLGKEFWAGLGIAWDEPITLQYKNQKWALDPNDARGPPALQAALFRYRDWIEAVLFEKDLRNPKEEHQNIQQINAIPWNTPGDLIINQFFQFPLEHQAQNPRQLIPSAGENTGDRAEEPAIARPFSIRNHFLASLFFAGAALGMGYAWGFQMDHPMTMLSWGSIPMIYLILTALKLLAMAVLARSAFYLRPHWREGLLTDIWAQQYWDLWISNPHYTGIVFKLGATRSGWLAEYDGDHTITVAPWLLAESTNSIFNTVRWWLLPMVLSHETMRYILSRTPFLRVLQSPLLFLGKLALPGQPRNLERLTLQRARAREALTQYILAALSGTVSHPLLPSESTKPQTLENQFMRWLRYSGPEAANFLYRQDLLRDSRLRSDFLYLFRQVNQALNAEQATSYDQRYWIEILREMTLHHQWAEDRAIPHTAEEALFHFLLDLLSHPEELRQFQPDSPDPETWSSRWRNLAQGKPYEARLHNSDVQALIDELDFDLRNRFPEGLRGGNQQDYFSAFLGDLCLRLLPMTTPAVMADANRSEDPYTFDAAMQLKFDMIQDRLDWLTRQYRRLNRQERQDLKRALERYNRLTKAYGNKDRREGLGLKVDQELRYAMLFEQDVLNRLSGHEDMNEEQKELARSFGLFGLRGTESDDVILDRLNEAVRAAQSDLVQWELEQRKEGLEFSAYSGTTGYTGLTHRYGDLIKARKFILSKRNLQRAARSASQENAPETDSRATEAPQPTSPPSRRSMPSFELPSGNLPSVSGNGPSHGPEESPPESGNLGGSWSTNRIWMRGFAWWTERVIAIGLAAFITAPHSPAFMVLSMASAWLPHVWLRADGAAYKREALLATFYTAAVSASIAYYGWTHPITLGIYALSTALHFSMDQQAADVLDNMVPAAAEATQAATGSSHYHSTLPRTIANAATPAIASLLSAA